MASEFSDSGTVLLVASVFWMPPFAWWVASRKLRYGHGKHWVVAHGAGFLSGVIAFFFSFIPVAIYEASQIVGIGVFAITGYWMRNMYRSIRDLGMKKTPQPSTSPSEPYTPSPDSPEIAAARIRSLDAMKRADDARQRDLKSSGEQPAQNIYASQYLADIEFDYRDASDNASHRHVGVEAVDDEYFEGHCYKAEATRTFVIGRVRGKVLDLDTGELLPPKKWADGVRNDPRNSGVVENRGWKSPGDKSDEVEDKPIEILFTGFSKDDRWELEELADIYDITVRKTVTHGLNYLCVGPNAGPAKLAQAAAAGVQIIDEDEFRAMLKL